MSEQHNEKAGELTMTELEQSSADLYALLASLWRAAPRGEQLAWLQGLQAMPGAAEAAMPTQAIAAHQVTNLAAFKAYAYAYLMGHPRIGKGPGMFLMVRTMETSPTGLPLQLFCYTNTTVWVEYEGIQGEIFDHLIGVLPQFGLTLYQRSSDYGTHYPAAKM